MFKKVSCQTASVRRFRFFNVCLPEWKNLEGRTWNCELWPSGGAFRRSRICFVYAEPLLLFEMQSSAGPSPSECGPGARPGLPAAHVPPRWAAAGAKPAAHAGFGHPEMCSSSGWLEACELSAEGVGGRGFTQVLLLSHPRLALRAEPRTNSHREAGDSLPTSPPCASHDPLLRPGPDSRRPITPRPWRPSDESKKHIRGFPYFICRWFAK